MSKSNYLENALLDGHLGGPAYALPPTLYLAAYTTAPDDTGGGVEVSGNNYARVAITNNATNWPAAANGSKSNGTVFTFPTATPAGWGNIVAVALLDALTGGNFLRIFPISPAIPVNLNDNLSFPVGKLVATED